MAIAYRHDERSAVLPAFLQVLHGVVRELPRGRVTPTRRPPRPRSASAPHST
jgi:hypothetical protein